MLVSFQILNSCNARASDHGRLAKMHGNAYQDLGNILVKPYQGTQDHAQSCHGCQAYQDFSMCLAQTIKHFPDKLTSLSRYFPCSFLSHELTVMLFFFWLTRLAFSFSFLSLIFVARKVRTKKGKSVDN